jgi:predicted RNA-binding Zn-ribbon protein involved in translation (DUF1610 family)
MKLPSLSLWERVGVRVVTMSYAEAWRENSRRWKWFLLWWIGGVVAMALLIPLLLLLIGIFVPPTTDANAVADVLFYVLAPIWLVGTLITASKLAAFRCPRCGQHFYLKGLVGNGFARRCMHCRLPVGAEDPPEGNAPTR